MEGSSTVLCTQTQMCRSWDQTFVHLLISHASAGGWYGPSIFFTSTLLHPALFQQSQLSKYESCVCAETDSNMYRDLWLVFFNCTICCWFNEPQSLLNLLLLLTCLLVNAWLAHHIKFVVFDLCRCVQPVSRILSSEGPVSQLMSLSPPVWFLGDKGDGQSLTAKTFFLLDLSLLLSPTHQTHIHVHTACTYLELIYSITWYRAEQLTENVSKLTLKTCNQWNSAHVSHFG